ncbi:DUF6294 family protein [Amycolatopsis sp. NPDC059657]|uniref:DUF6294 family protein n=1 Tax=Amycolatopsis sp. NPDC059657 TaxID=3346899 RepID=UPI00366AE55B
MRFSLTVAAVAAITGSSLAAAPAEAAGTVTVGATAGVAWKSYTWEHDLHAGDCTLFGGATWTIRADGTASFQGTVTSSDRNDAWLMRAFLKNSSNVSLVPLYNQAHDVADWKVFAQNLPDPRLRYDFSRSASYDKRVFDQVSTMGLLNDC